MPLHNTAFLTPFSPLPSPSRPSPFHATHPRRAAAAFVVVAAAKAAPAAASPPAKAKAKADAKVGPVSVSVKGARARGYLRGHKSILAPETGDFSATAAALFRKCDTARWFVSEEEIETNAHELSNAEVLRKILAHKDDIVTAGLDAMTSAAPSVGADDALRASCRFDLVSILRVLSYAASVEASDYLHQENLPLYKVFYDELGLTLGPLLVAIEAMEQAVGDAKSTQTFEALKSMLRSYM